MQRISIKDLHPPSILISVRNPRPYYASHHNISCWFKKIFFFHKLTDTPLKEFTMLTAWEASSLARRATPTLRSIRMSVLSFQGISKTTFFQLGWISEAVKFWEDIIRIFPSLHGWYPKKNGIYPPNLRIYKNRPIKPQFFWNHFHAH